LTCHENFLLNYAVSYGMVSNLLSAVAFYVVKKTQFG